MNFRKHFCLYKRQSGGLWWLLGVLLILILNSTPSNAGHYTSDACRSIHGRLGTCIDLASCPLFNGWLKVRPVIKENLRMLIKYTCYYGSPTSNPKVCCPNDTLDPVSQEDEDDIVGIRLATPIRHGVGDTKIHSSNKLLFPEPPISFTPPGSSSHHPPLPGPFPSSSFVDVQKLQHIPLSFPTERSVPMPTWNTLDKNLKDPSITKKDLRHHPNFRLIPKLHECSNAVKLDSQNGAYGSYPWIALVGIKRSRSLGFEHVCAGAIINNRYILTAAHCFGRGRGNVKNVRLGEYNLQTLIDDGSEYLPQSRREDYRIDKFTTHPQFNPNTGANDIALIRVDKPISLNATFIKAVCLPFVTEYELENRLNISNFKNLDGKPGWVAGWSRHSWDGYSIGSDSTVLQEGIAEINAQEGCEKDHPNLSFSSRTQICVGGKGRRNSCVVDSGGPLLYPIKVPSPVKGFVEPKFFLLGLLSRGPTGPTCKIVRNDEEDEEIKEAASRLLPTSVFTDVSKYLSWILDNLQE